MLRPVPADSQVALEGVIGEAGGFTRTIHLKGATADKLRVSTSGLHGPTRIDESLIAATIVPAAKGARKVTIAVSGIVEPGAYHGRLTLARGRARCMVRLRVDARERPQLAPLGGDAVSVNVTRCWWVCPKSEKVAFTLTDPGRALVTASNIRVKLYRHKDGDKLQGLTATDIQLSGRDAGTLLLTVDKRELRAGHYDGVALLDVAGENSPVAVPVSADVKDGRALPLLVIAVAFLVRLLAGHLRRRSETQDVWRGLNDVQESVRRLTETEQRSLLGHVIEANRRWEAGDTAGVLALVTKINGWRDMLLEARGLLARTPTDRAQPVRDAIAVLRRRIADGDQAKIDATMADVRDAAHEAGLGGDPDGKILEADPGEVKVETVERPGFFKRGVEATAGYLRNPVGPRTLANSLLTNVLEVVLVVALVFVVLQEAYFSNDTFGADWLKDYGALFVTALGATAVGRLVVDVVSRRALLGSDA